MAAQYVCILFYEFLLNVVEIATNFANCQRYNARYFKVIR